VFDRVTAIICARKRALSAAQRLKRMKVTDEQPTA
jgi:hypothetical protein